jgi:outer membrane lipoprotein carrier protein
MLKSLKVLLFFVFSISTAFAASNSIASSTTALQKVTKKYRSTKLVEMSVEKTVKSELLGKETKHEGKIFLGAGKFRWENTKPEKTLLVYDGKTIWSEQSPPPEFGGPVQVARGKVDKKTKSHILLSTLIGTDIKKNFKVLSDKKEGDILTVDVQPLQDDLNIKAMSLRLNTKDNTLNQVSYKDDIGNTTTLTFTNVNFLKSEKKNLFKYQPPKDAQVTDL